MQREWFSATFNIYDTKKIVLAAGEKIVHYTIAINWTFGTRLGKTYMQLLWDMELGGDFGKI